MMAHQELYRPNKHRPNNKTIQRSVTCSPSTSPPKNGGKSRRHPAPPPLAVGDRRSARAMADTLLPITIPHAPGLHCPRWPRRPRRSRSRRDHRRPARWRVGLLVQRLVHGLGLPPALLMAGPPLHLAAARGVPSYDRHQPPALRLERARAGGLRRRPGEVGGE